MVGVVGGGITGLKVTLQVERDQINKFGSINMIERKNCSTLVRPKLNKKSTYMQFQPKAFPNQTLSTQLLLSLSFINSKEVFEVLLLK